LAAMSLIYYFTCLKNFQWTNALAYFSISDGENKEVL